MSVILAGLYFWHAPCSIGDEPNGSMIKKVELKMKGD